MEFYMYINGRVSRDGSSLAESQFLDSRGRLSANRGSVVIGGIPEHQSIRASEHQSIRASNIRASEHQTSLEKPSQNITSGKTEYNTRKTRWWTSFRNIPEKAKASNITYRQTLGRPLDCRRIQTIENYSA